MTKSLKNMSEDISNEINKINSISIFTDSCSGVLYVEDTKCGELRWAISPWHKGLVVCRKIDFSWTVEVKPPDLDLIALGKLDHCKQEVERFFKYIPSEVLKFVEQFESFNLQMLKTLKSSNVARELVTKSPALLWRLLNYLLNNSSFTEKIEDFKSIKRLEIIRMIYGDYKKSVLILMDRFLKRVVFSQYSVCDSINMIHLDVAVKSQKTLKALGAMKKIPIILLGFLFSHPELVTYPLIFRFSAVGNWAEETFHIWQWRLEKNHMYCRDALTAARLLRIPNARRVLNRCKNVCELRELHGEWVWRLNASNTFEHSTEPFPAPPITGTSAIEAIKNGEDLSREGREMRHCISIYCVSVYAGNNYVYRVLRPERGTLLLANKDGYWSIEEFRLEKNKSPRKESWDCVRNWHDTYHKSFSR